MDVTNITNIIIRKAELTDNTKIDECNRKVLPENYEIEVYDNILKSSSTSCFVADNDNEIVGYILTTLQYDNKKNIIGHIISIGVIDEYRKHGLGSKLLAAAEDDLRSKYKIGYLSLHVRKRNKDAIIFYSKMGFMRAKKVKEYYGKNEDAFLMKKTYQ